MFDSDEDFPDDFVLDDQTLAILDKEESRFEESRRVDEPDVEDLPPPAKRQKLDTGPPQDFSAFSRSPDDTENLPDITLCDDDTYKVELPQQSIISAPQATSIVNPSLIALERHLACLRKQKNELHKEKVRLQEELRHTLSAKLAKEGEVVILRKNIEKRKQRSSGRPRRSRRPNKRRCKKK
ncbi:uncharacterized protein HD556DRAFT_706905 [Suillus plorans]|uniref:Uncharacterized protein n=1 Tax=Suillus plorans TaxID=116603 RepID=A0A9P7DTK4_9AGAM|nr:uncharacterized protein HD556DRAFT_706905 [Suillus plorans]KAG1802696.1 hypothetical protein HD556DRAFT_706905 [Suillus plorans]